MPGSDADKVKFDMFDMQTPTGAPVISIQHAGDYSIIAEELRWDCMNYVLDEWDSFNYGIQAGSIWDVLNDPQLAFKVVDNEPPVKANSTSQLVSNKLIERDSIFTHRFPVNEESDLRPRRGDILVFWYNATIEGNEYLRAGHAVRLEQPIFAADGKLLSTTVVKTKNGQEKPKTCTLEEVREVYELDFTSKAPAGIYRLIRRQPDARYYHEQC